MQSYERIMVPIDFSKGSIRAAQRALQLAAPEGHVDLVHVARIPPQLMSPAAEIPFDYTSNLIGAQQDRELLESELRGLYNQLEPLNPDVHLDSRVIFGEPASVIVEESKNYDLVVVGASHHTWLARFLLGSITAKTVQEAKCPVLVERDRES